MALLVLVFIILHLGIGLVLPYNPGFKPYIYRWMEEAGVDIERRLNRETRPQSVRVVRGTMVALLMGVLAVVVGLVVHYAGRTPYGILVQLLFFAGCINFMTPMKVARQVLADIEDLPKCRTALQPYVQEPLEHADGHTLIRRTVEFIALALNGFLLAPLFWVLAAGPVGLSIYVTYAALRQAFGLPDKRRKYFGQCVRGVDTVMNIVPAALGVIFIVTSGLFVQQRSASNHITVGVIDQCRAAGFSYERWLIAAMASGLGMTLGGAVRYNETYAENNPWLGPEEGTARLIPDDLLKVIHLQYAFLLCTAVMISVFMATNI